MGLRSLILTLAAAGLVAGCSSDGASWEISGREHSLSILREQALPWSNKANLYLVVSRMPHCMRRHTLKPGTMSTKIEVWQVPSGAFIIRYSKGMFVTEAETCESFAKLDAEPPEGLGEKKGVFQMKKGEFVFVPEPPAAPAPESAPAANPQ